jgi:photosystem I subunit IX
LPNQLIRDIAPELNPQRPTSAAMKKFLTTAPVFAAIWFTLTAGIMIEFNRFFPDLLFHPL